jgi:hypothetical protein
VYNFYRLGGPHPSTISGPLDLSEFGPKPACVAAHCIVPDAAHPDAWVLPALPSGPSLVLAPRLTDEPVQPLAIVPSPALESNPAVSAPKEPRPLQQDQETLALSPPEPEPETEPPDEDEELDPRMDPLQKPGPISLSEWEATVRLIRPRPPLSVNNVQLRHMVTELMARIREVDLRSDPSRQAEAERILAALPSLLRDPKNFVAGTFTACHAVWAALLEGSKRKSARTVLGWGKTRFVGTAEAKPSKRDLVIGMLKRQVPESQIPHMLSGTLPHPVQFENHKSFYDNSEFALGEVAKLILWSAGTIVQEGEEFPIVIHPLGVAFTGGKGRLIVNARYCNLFMKLLRFRYERLRDILGFTKEGFYMADWDQKSGYYHVLLHPKVRKYFGIRVGNIVIRLNVVFFGYAQACYVFTKITQEPAFALREAGIPVSSYVDDGFTAAATRLTCLWQALFAVLLQATLGGFHGLPKCQIEPVLVIKWLGFMLDSVNQRFEVGPAKLEKLKVFIQELLGKTFVSARDLAQAAGKIISLSPAVAPAALYSRSFFQAIKGSLSWDAIFPHPGQVRKTLQIWLANLDRFKGRPWWSQPLNLRVAVDASGVGFGGVLTGPAGYSHQFQGTFTPEQAAGSRTLQEVLGYVGTVSIAAEAKPESLAGSSILITGDIQGAVSCINNLRSPVKDINEALRGLFRVSSELNCNVLARWVPRERLTEADSLSRELDATNWEIDMDLFAKVCRRFDIRPLVDLFASDIHHTADIFVTKTYTPGCAGVDAF